MGCAIAVEERLSHATDYPTIHLPDDPPPVCRCERDLDRASVRGQVAPVLGRDGCENLLDLFATARLRRSLPRTCASFDRKFSSAPFHA